MSLKIGFASFSYPPTYPLEIQICILAALSAVHNFICCYKSIDNTHGVEDDNVEFEDSKDIDLPLCDRITDTMWDHYTVLKSQLDLDDLELKYIDLDVDVDLDNSDCYTWSG